MTTSLRILTSATLDSYPAVILTSPDGSKILVNCGEGCQRSFLESSSSPSGSLRVRSVSRVCLTHLGPEAVGGLPGFILTASDAIGPVPAVASDSDSAAPSSRKRKDQPRSHSGTDPRPGLDVLGPPGTARFLHSLRHFMKRDRFRVTVREGAYDGTCSPPPSEAATALAWTGAMPKKTRKLETRGERESNRKGDAGSPGGGSFRIQSIPITTSCPPQFRSEITVCSYVFTTPPIAGKFRPEKAKALGIPPGPLYGRLKAGQEVSYADPSSGKERVATPRQVLDAGNPGVAIFIVYVPSPDVLRKLEAASPLQTFRVSSKTPKCRPTLEVMVHITPRELFSSTAYQRWMFSFGKDVDHITLHTLSNFTGESEEYDGTPFRCAARGALSRALINPEVFLCPCRLNNPNAALDGRQEESSGTTIEDKDVPGMIETTTIIEGRTMMEYILIPLSRSGLVGADAYAKSKVHWLDGMTKDEKEEVMFSTEKSGAKGAAAAILAQSEEYRHGFCHGTGDHGELIFTGTGSAIPCKHRNVTGKYLRMENGRAIMLDVGEGTMGQLFRCWKHSHNHSLSKGRSRCDQFRRRLVDIKAVWISHPHADHHLGLLRLLTERAEALNMSSTLDEEDPLVLMAPPAMFYFLEEYGDIDPRIRGTYLKVDCSEMLSGKRNPMQDKLHRDLGIKSCFSVPVAHCPHAYAIILDGTVFGRLVYSGDCRPSSQLARLGYGADLLIHEATFEDGMEADAVIKRHSTVGEALEVGKKMNAKAVVLTHFSQRYPRIPPVRQNLPKENSELADVPVVTAFDFMCLRPETVQLAAALTPALRLLYPNEGNNEEDDSDANNILGSTLGPQPSAKEILNEPGAFAFKALL